MTIILSVPTEKREMIIKFNSSEDFSFYSENPNPYYYISEAMILNIVKNSISRKREINKELFNKMINKIIRIRIRKLINNKIKYFYSQETKNFLNMQYNYTKHTDYVNRIYRDLMND